MSLLCMHYSFFYSSPGPVVIDYILIAIYICQTSMIILYTQSSLLAAGVDPGFFEGGRGGWGMQ